MNILKCGGGIQMTKSGTLTQWRRYQALHHHHVPTAIHEGPWTVPARRHSKCRRIHCNKRQQGSRRHQTPPRSGAASIVLVCPFNNAPQCQIHTVICMCMLTPHSRRLCHSPIMGKHDVIHKTGSTTTTIAYYNYNTATTLLVIKHKSAYTVRTKMSLKNISTAAAAQSNIMTSIGCRGWTRTTLYVS